MVILFLEGEDVSLKLSSRLPLPLEVLDLGNRLGRLNLGLGCDDDDIFLDIAFLVVQDEFGGEASGDADESR